MELIKCMVCNRTLVCFTVCDACGREYEGDCPEHGPLNHFVDSFVSTHNIVNCNMRYRICL